MNTQSPPELAAMFEEGRQFFERPNFEECKQILAAFGNARGGFFVEVGANDPRTNSVTYLLERWGWTGILIEPFRKCYQQLVQARPGSRSFHCACVAPERVGKVTLHLPDSSAVAASIDRNVDDFDIHYAFSEECDAVTLDSLVEQIQPAQIDLLSLDTEGTELEVLLGFNLTRRRPRLILIEDKLYNLTKHRYLRRHGYRLVKRTMLNNWYVPEENPPLEISISFSQRLALWRKMQPVSAYFRRKRREAKRRAASI